MSLDNLIGSLKNKLEQPLPGINAHFKMAPPMRFKDMQRYQPNDTTKDSAVLILIYLLDGKPYLPLILRPENAGVHSGQVALPGGKKDETDEDLVATALREAWEEIGVNVERQNVVGQLSRMYIPPSNFLVYPVIAFLNHKPDFLPSADEVVKILEIDVLDFLQNDKMVVKEITTKYMKAEVPCYELEGHIVWGATAMILSELADILQDIL